MKSTTSTDQHNKTMEVAMQTEPSINGGDVLARAMTDSAIGMALVTPDGRILSANPALCEFFGYPAEVLVGMTVNDVTHPHDLDADLDHADKVMAGVMDSYHLRKRYIHADGTVLTGYLTVSGIRDDRGGVELFVAQVVDITREATIEDNLRLLAEHGTDVIARDGNDGVLRWVSPSITRATGWQPEQLVGVALLDLVHPDDRELVTSTQDSLVDGTNASCNVRMMHMDGTFSWFAVHVDLVCSASGKRLGRIGTWRPIDGEVEARQLAQKRESDFRLLAENATDLVIRISQDGRLTWVSPSVVTTLGWDPDDVIGRSPAQFLHPHDADEMVARVMSLTIADPSLEQARRVLLADGTYHWFSVRASRVTDPDGAPAGRVIGLRDIDAEVQAKAALEASERIFRTAMDAAPGGMAVSDLEGRFLKVNKALAAMLGRTTQWLTEHRIDDVLHPDDRALNRVLRSQIHSGLAPTKVEESRLLRADGTVVWVEHAIGLVHDESGAPVSYVSQFVDISEARESRRELEFLAGHDPLTRLSNRRTLLERMGTALRQIPRTGTRIGVVFLDLDGLKQVNDQHGHAAGDELIVNVAKRIRSAVRDDDIVARLGGDEFVVVLIRVHDLQDAVDVADKVRNAVAAPIAAGGHALHVTVSAGVTLAEPSDAPDQAIDRADQLLYRAKAAGGNQVLAG